MQYQITKRNGQIDLGIAILTEPQLKNFFDTVSILDLSIEKPNKVLVVDFVNKKRGEKS